MRTLQRLLCLVALASIAACGGGPDAPAAAPTSPTSPPTSMSPPGGLYVGYYAEDPVNNPEDPTLGAFSLNLPNSNGTFSGSMFFTYVGCQTSNVGTVSGTKTDLNLTGVWSGTIDGVLQSGNYAGTYDPVLLRYQGTYTTSGGKQYRDLRPCIDYFIAANGRWEMFPIDSRVPSTFNPSVTNRTISWPTVSGAAQALVYVLDPTTAQTTGNPVTWQSFFVGTATTASVPQSVTLQTGREYVVVVVVADAAGTRIAFGSRRFTP